MQLNLIFFNKLFSILISMIPFLMITGGFIPDVILSLTGLYFIFICIKLNLWDYFKNKIILLFLFFIAYISLRGLFTVNSFHTFFTSLVYFRYLFFSLGIVYLLLNFKKFIDYFFIGTAVALIIIVLDTYIEWFFGSNIFGWKTMNKYRLSSFFRDELIVGAFIIKIFILYFIAYHKSKYKNFILDKFFLIFLFLIILIVFASGERSAFFLSILFFLLAILIIDKDLLLISKFKIILILILTFFSTIFLDDNIKHRMVDHTLDQLNEKTIAFLPYTIHHEEHYISALKMFMDKPVIGHGSGLFRFLCSKEQYYNNSLSCSTHPHNFYIQLLAENGTIAFIIFSLFYFSVLKIFIFETYKKYFQKENYNDESIYCSAGLIIFLWPLIPTMDFFNQWSNIPLFILFGFYLSNLSEFKKLLVK